MRFEFATAKQILFGPGITREIGPVAQSLGRRVLLVTGRNPARAEPILNRLKDQKLSVSLLPGEGEPTLDYVKRGVALAREQDCDLVIGFGGGSTIDAGKAIAALVTNVGDVMDYIEVIGGGKLLTQTPLPFLAIPTTAGAGAEVTRNAVLTSPEHRVKASLRSPLLLPRLALVDPELTVGLPPALTASTGLDALTQLIEASLSRRANPLTDCFCLDGIARVVRSIRRAVESPADMAAREDMALGSLWSGLALANAGLGAVHGFAAPIGGMFPAPHGAVCAALLPHVMRVNGRALQARASQSPVLARFRNIACLLTGRPEATIDQGVRWIESLCRDLQIPTLKVYGVNPADVNELCEKAALASSMKANPVVLTRRELEEILQGAMGVA